MLNVPSVYREIALSPFTLKINLLALLFKTLEWRQSSLIQYFSLVILGKSASSILFDLQQHLVAFGLCSSQVNIFCSSFKLHYTVYHGLYCMVSPLMFGVRVSLWNSNWSVCRLLQTFCYHYLPLPLPLHFDFKYLGRSSHFIKLWKCPRNKPK